MHTTADAPGSTRRALPVALLPAAAAVLALLVVLVVGGGLGLRVSQGLPDPGAVTRWGLPLTRLAVDLSALMTVGTLVVAVVLVPRGTSGRAISAVARAAAGWAGLWAASAAAAATLTVADVTGIPLQRLAFGEMATAAWALPGARALLLAAGLAVVVLGCLAAGRSRGQDALALAVAVLALTPPLYVGHAAHAGEHQVATGSLVVHVVAASVWVGSLAALVLHLRGDRSVRVAAASRFSTLALACFGVLTASGGLSAVARLGTSRASWLSAYGAVLTVKIVAVVVLGAMGWAHRRWTLDLLRRGRPGAFARLAAVELLVMGATVGVAVALSRTPGPVDQATLERLGRSAGPGLVEPFSFAQLAHDWRPEPVLTTVVVLALTAYLSAARNRRTAGVVWPRGRSLSAASAATVAVVTLGLPTGYDDRPLLAVQVAQTLVLALVVPPLIALAAPLRLLGGDPWRVRTARLLQPFTGFALLVGTVTLVLQSPARQASASSSPTHLVVLAAALVAGVFFCCGLLAPGATVRQQSEVLGATALFLAALGGALAAAPAAGAPTATAAAQLGHEQQIAALVTWCGALVLAGATAAVVRRSTVPAAAHVLISSR